MFQWHFCGCVTYQTDAGRLKVFTCDAVQHARTPHPMNAHQVGRMVRALTTVLADRPDFAQIIRDMKETDEFPLDTAEPPAPKIFKEQDRMFVKHECGCIKWKAEDATEIPVYTCPRRYNPNHRPMTDDEIVAFLIEVGDVLTFAHSLVSPLKQIEERSREV